MEIKERLRSLIGRKLDITFHSGLFGGSVAGTLSKVYKEFIELRDCDVGTETQIVNLRTLDNIEIIEDEDN